MYHFKNRCQLFSIEFLGLCLCVSYMSSVAAQEVNNQSKMESVTSKWECKWCPVEDEGTSQTKMEGGVMAEDAGDLIKRFFVMKRNLN